jgi:putative glycosyltransferase (TIGR04372 family)
MRYLKKLFQYFISYSIYFFLNLIFPLFKIRFGRIYANRIGHLCFNTDNYLSIVSEKKNIITFFCYDEPVSNEFLFKLFIKNKKIFFTNKIRFIYNIFHHINSNSKLLVSNAKETHPRVSFTATKKRNLPSIVDYEPLKKFLGKNNISNKFICINNRDNKYLQDINSPDKNFHDYRNFEIESFDRALQHLLNEGYFIIRVGKISEKPINIKDKKIFDLTNENYNEQLQILLLEKCFFFIGGSSGISQVQRIFRKPSLLINYTPFDIMEMSAWSKNSIFLPKKLFSLNEKRYLNFREMNDLNYDIHYKGNFFKDKNIDVVNNTEEEILNACKEMIEYQKNNFERTEKNKVIQDTFWRQFEDNQNLKYYTNQIREKIDFGISEYFVNNNNELLKNND